MKISAKVGNSFRSHDVELSTNGITQQLNIPAKTSGYGSAVNGGELLFLALATCYCNDLYREAAKMNITLTKVSVEASGEFGQAGEPGFNITYQAKVEGEAADAELQKLLEHTDRMAEIQNTLRRGVEVKLVSTPSA